ncbi:MAG: phage tail tape measure protein [Clostridiales bacterium]|nr:phage tail tape measure protein [Clostridiales bacterium]
MSDGSIKIGTELDTTGIEKGLNTVKNQNRRTFEQMAKNTGKSVEEIRELFHKTVERIKKEYAELNNGKPLDNANAHKKAYKELGLLAEKNAKEVSKQADKISDSYEKSANFIPTFFKKGFANLGSVVKSGIAGLGSITKTAVAGITTAIAGVSTGIGGLGAASISVGKNFETAMSKVQATSGASADDLERLKEKALEMGASTKFSASESAEVLNYMAMAGWKTEQMIGGIGGIMDLAAASGEDLAMVSDIVTDGLTAFGLSANESGRFADVLAAASSNANTNVSMLGESFKYVAPVAGALGYSIEDTSVALGLMANAGIKASQSGTSLRTLMTNLASPTKNSAMAIQQLGLNIQDAKGNMLPFNDVMVQLRDGFNGLTEAEKAQYAEMLAGKEGMSGLLAIVNSSQADFDKLTGAINNSSGGAAEMAEIMSDNLQGRLDELSSRLETLGIKIYESIQVHLKEVTEYATGLVTELQNAFDKGGFEGVINSLGTIISKALTDIAAKAQPVKATITAIQNDQNSRYIDVDLKDKGNPVDLTNATVKIFVKRPPTKTPCPKLPTDTFIYNIGQITDAENGRVQFALTTDFLKEPGRLECEISVEKIVKDQSEVLTTPIFNILVSETLKNNKLIESKNGYGALVLMYENIVEASRFLILAPFRSLYL